jgi:hypothetical protein
MDIGRHINQSNFPRVAGRPPKAYCTDWQGKEIRILSNPWKWLE